MGELEEKISGILNNPLEMEKITQLASRLLGGGGDGEKSGEKGEEKGGEKRGEKGGERPLDLGLPGLDGEMLSRVSRLLTSGGGGNDNSALLRAMLPYLKDTRREKMEKAMRFAKMAKIAGVAFREYGEGNV